MHVRNDNAALGAVSVNNAAEGEIGSQDPAPAFDSATGDAPTLSPRIDLARDPSRVAIDGTLRVHRARYLHVQADLLYYRPVDGGGGAPMPAEDDPNESRRMRSRELHYLDHPLFGVLVEAWPVELPELPAEPVETTPPVEGESAAEESGAAQPAPLLPVPTAPGSGG